MSLSSVIGPIVPTDTVARCNNSREQNEGPLKCFTFLRLQPHISNRIFVESVGDFAPMHCTIYISEDTSTQVAVTRFANESRVEEYLLNRQIACHFSR